MYDVFDSWDELAADPSSSTSTLVGGGSSSSGSNNDTSNDEEASSLSSSSSGNSNNIQSVGRDVISSACLLRASAALRTKIRSRGGDEVYEWERWLRRELWLRNSNQQVSLQEQQKQKQDEEKNVQVEQVQKRQQKPWQGKDFFHKEIQPASISRIKKLRLFGVKNQNIFFQNLSKLYAHPGHGWLVPPLPFLSFNQQ